MKTGASAGIPSNGKSGQNIWEYGTGNLGSFQSLRCKLNWEGC